MKKLTKLNNQHFVNGSEPRGYGVVGEALGAIEGMMLLGSIFILMIVIVPIIVGLALIYFGLPALLGDANSALSNVGFLEFTRVNLPR